MIFITEEDLRDLYKSAPFTTYNPEEGTRLTPGARQFLVDRGIDLYSQEARTANFQQLPKSGPLQKIKGEDLPLKRINARIRSLHGSFLEAVSIAIQEDPAQAQELSVLSRQLENLRKSAPEWNKTTDLCCLECTGIKKENFNQDLGECFEISEIHLQAPRGKEIIHLHQLRNQLQELDLMIWDLYPKGSPETVAADQLSSKIQQMVNTMNRMICAAFGGEKCLRQE